MDAIELLKKDHRAVEELFQRFNDGGGLTGIVKRLTGNATPPQQRRQLADRICGELDLHALIEEEIFYPAVRQLGDPKLDEYLQEAANEHAQIKERVRAVRSADDAETELRNAVSSLQECVDHHVREEENEMFPLVEEHMPERERTTVGRELAARKRTAAPRRATPRARKTTKGTSPATTARRRRVRKVTAKARKRSSAAAKRRATSGRRR